ncbi:choice-of-anchor I domain-containing protein [Synechococcus sp. CS-1328]|uniref:choice-of-anchor I domain-containing protein n=1 Tax=Synechococcus sp. CS-1328 TaxID=2847976 RepID=UPI00223BDFFC|nr:esterase-like activity of phytase family protein [Synechococcus sp. CS-1328]MCT0223725.1 esterase-like activity of phytase family protein [Synechococcus sp. CS-1328]
MTISASSSSDLGGAEITAYAPAHQVSLVITGGNQLEVVDLRDPTNPVPLPGQTQTLPGSAQSVDVAGNLAAVAVAGGGLDPRIEPGQVVFFTLAGSGGSVTLTEAGSVGVGYLPDSLAFNTDGSKLVVANEGEPSIFYGTAEGIDPPGSISVIDVNATSPAASSVTELGFDAQQTAYLRARGVRISGVPDTTAATGIEPEYVSVSGNTAYVTLQENNAVAVVDLSTNTIRDIRSLGIKDWSRGIPSATDVPFEIPYQASGDLPMADPNFPDQQVVAGGLSGLFFDPTENLYYTITDRGPQANDIPSSYPIAAFQGEKIFQDPSFTPTIYALAGDVNGISLIDVLPLQVPYLDAQGQLQFRNATGIGELFTVDATPGVEAVSGIDDAAFMPDGSGSYVPVSADAFGLDTESVVRFSRPDLNGGNPVFAVSDEYRPQIALFDAATGQLIQRFVPEGTDFSAITYEPGRGDVPGYTADTLPTVYANRQSNRGFEGMAYSSTDGLLYAFIQSPLQPDGFNSSSTLRRILAVDPNTGSPQAEYLYIQFGAANQDKIGDAVYDAERDVFYVIDRDSGTARNSNKAVLEFDLAAASNVLGYDWLGALGVAQPEQLDAVTLSNALVSAGVAQVHQNELFNLPSIGANPAFDKAEGLALLPDGSLVVGYDNDFLAQAGRPDNQLSFVTFTPQPIDTSDRDGGFNPAVRDFYGLRMADAIATFTYEGEVFTITANEGDGRVRPDTLNFEATLPDGSTYWYGTVDPGAGVEILASLPDPSDPTGATTLFVTAAEQPGFQMFQADLGDEFFLSSTQGAVADDDFFNDELRKSRLKTVSDFNTPTQDYGYGGRSFTIFDSKGNVAFDSGNQLEAIAVSLGVYDDGRSDDKGTEPEGVTTAVIEGRTYAFVGLERATSSTVLVYDITNPYQPVYSNALVNEGSLSPEGLEYVPTQPDGSGFLQVANEVSGTLDTYSIGNGDIFTLELFHLSDQEAQAAAIGDAPRLSAVYRALADQDLGNDGFSDNSLFLSSGDQYIPGVFADASRQLFGAPGVADILIQNELGIQASAFGNHEFDFGTALVKGLIDGSAANYAAGLDPLIPAFRGTDFPYLSGNLDFSTDPNLAPLVVADASAPQGNVISGSTQFLVGGEWIGVVAATTPTLQTISSPGGVGASPSPFSGTPTPEQLDALAAVIQADVDALLAANPGMNKVILLSHMQQLSIEEQLASRLTGVDIIVAGGSNTRLFDENDAIRAGDSQQGDYPVGREGVADTSLLAAADGSPVALVNTDGSYKYLGRLVLDFDGNGLLLPESYDPAVSGAFATDEAGVEAVGGSGLEDPEIVAIVAEIEKAIVAKESNVYGISSVFLNGERAGAEPDGVRTQETNLGNLSADANLVLANQIAQELGETSPVVFSIKNGGGIRASIGQVIVPPGGTAAERLPNEEIPGVKPAGGISEADITKALAFNNNLALLTLTRSEIVALLEHGVSALPNAAGQFLQISGARFSFDSSRPAGDRLVNAGLFGENNELLAELVRDGEIVGSSNELFRIVTLDFLARGGDGYPFPDINLDRVDYVNLGTVESGGVDTGDGEATFAEDGTEQDALAEYLLDRHAPDSGTPFAAIDTDRSGDLRIQNLEFAVDSVLPAATTPTPAPAPSPSPSPSRPPADSPLADFASVEFLGNGDDQVQGTGGNDFVSAGGGNDAVNGGAGDDDLRGNGGDDRLEGGEGNDFQRGGQGRDSVNGGFGNDQLLGDRGSDSVTGGEGNDILNGNGGDDILFGGAGADQFRLSPGNDVIADFSFAEGDTLAMIAGQSFSLGQDAGGNTLVVRDGFGTTTLLGISLLDFQALSPSPLVFL